MMPLSKLCETIYFILPMATGVQLGSFNIHEQTGKVLIPDAYFMTANALALVRLNENSCPFFQIEDTITSKDNSLRSCSEDLNLHQS